MEPTPRPAPPRQDCPDAQDCIVDASEIGHICTFGPICGTCVVYRPRELQRGLLAGTCRIRPDRGTFPCTAPICDQYVPRGGALDAKGRPTDGGQPAVVQIARAAARASRQAVSGGRSAHREPPPPPIKIPDGPCGELEMTREELKTLIREAMDEERGGGLTPLAPKWEGGVALLKPADPNLQGKELPLDALFHKVVMIRDRLRVLEQKVNAHPKLTDAEKVDLQSYVTRCYGSLTTFNVLFRDREDGFTGTGGKDE
jgi:hypothetical protein